MSEILLLSAAQVESVCPAAGEAVSLIRLTLEQHAQGALEMPPKSGVHPPAGRHVHAMSAFIPGMQALGLKWIADFPRNPSMGLPTLSAVVILNDPETGVPLCLMDGVRITATRTAAMTAVSLLAVARPGADTATIVGTGIQARAQARTLSRSFPELRRIFVVGSELPKAITFCEEIGSSKFLAIGSRQQAVEASDIVITVTNAVRDPLLDHEWLKPGVTAVVLDNGGKETRILPFMDRIIVDDRRAFDSEEVRHRFTSGVPRLDAEIGEILSGKAEGRRSVRERILVLNLGIAACDIAVAAEVYRRACDVGIGTRFRL